MYKTAAILYIVCFFCYVLFSRNPDYFESDFTSGIVAMDNNRNKSVNYRVGSEAFNIKITGWGATEVAEGEKVKVIFDPSNPLNASLYSFFGYWFKLSELLLSIAGFITLFIAAVFITGKEQPYYYNEEESLRKRKYND